MDALIAALEICAGPIAVGFALTVICLILGFSKSLSTLFAKRIADESVRVIWAETKDTSIMMLYAVAFGCEFAGLLIVFNSAFRDHWEPLRMPIAGIATVLLLIGWLGFTFAQGRIFKKLADRLYPLRQSRR